MRGLVDGRSLNTRQAAFVHNYAARGMSLEAAHEAAGYEASSSNVRNASAHALLGQPAVANAIQAVLARQLKADAIEARRVALDLMKNASSEKVRADLATKLLRLGGHVEPRAEIADTRADKPLAELSMEELRARAEALEDELASRAKLIPSASDVPLDPQVADLLE